MEKIIFFGLEIPILEFVLYLGGTAIMKGFEAKRENKSNESLEDQDHEDNLSDNNDKLTDEFDKLNKKKFLECIYCSSNKIRKSIMAPMVSG